MSWLTKLAVWLFTNRKEVEQVSEEVIEVVSPKEPSNPLSHKDVDTIEKQIDSATSHKVVK